MDINQPSILVISSMVSAGHVGLSAIIPTLNTCGIEAIGLPTTILSNHPGFGKFAGMPVAPETLTAMLGAIEQNGWLGSIETVLTGYLPTAGHALFAETAITTVRRHNPDARYICDPVLGDDPKGVYIDQAAATAIRDRLMPIADIITPNRFELAWLTGRQVSSPETAIAAARTLPCPRTIAKSVPADDGRLANLDIRRGVTEISEFGRLDGVPNGTGDMMSALIAAGWPLDRITAALEAVIKPSLGLDHLAIVTTAPQWLAANPGEPALVAGADGCPGGWIMVSHPVDRPAEATCHLFTSFAELLDFTTNHRAVAIDMPIGLPDIATPGGRAADREARAVLGARQSSVFAVPARAAIACLDYREACTTALAHSDPPRKVAKQTFNLFPKIREIDALMTPDLQSRVIECHPEVCFWAMNGQTALDQPKKQKSRPYPEGLALRRGLLEAQGFTPEFLAGPGLPRKIAASDDFLDACATAWTANRHAAGHSQRFPAAPGKDRKGLRMEIVY